MENNKLIFIMGISFLLISCSGNSGSKTLEDSRLVSAEQAYVSWPNSSTTKSTSNQITSPVLISDLNKDGVHENIFITVLPNSTQPENSILRLTESGDYIEVINYNAISIPLFQQSHPFSYDIDADGDQEILLVGYDLDKVYCFDFKDNELDRIYIRWSAKLPQGLAPGFNPQMKVIQKDDQEMIQIDNYGIYEKNHRKPKVIFINPPANGQDDDDDD